MERQVKSVGDTEPDLTTQNVSDKNNDSTQFARFGTGALPGIHQHSTNLGDTQSTTRDNCISQSSTQLINVSETVQGAVYANEPNRTTISAEDAPGSEMGYSNTIQSHSRSPQSASIKMERTPSLHSSSSGTKDADESQSVDSPVGRGAVPANFPAVAPQSPRSPLGSRLSEGVEALSASVFGTPSTISTAPSTDEASADGTDSVGLERAMSWKLDDFAASPMILSRTPIIQSIPANDSAQHGVARMPSPEAAVSGEQFYHRRSRSWEEEQRHHRGLGQAWEDSPVAPPYTSTHGHGAHTCTWEQVVSPQTRVASFRNNTESRVAHGYANVAAHPDAWHQVQHRHSHGQHLHMDATSVPGYQQASYGGFHGQRAPVYGQQQHPSGSQTPPRSKQPRSPLHTPSRSPLHTPSRSPNAPSTPVSGSPSPSGANPPRSSSEILKTLLRKKACLYEPDTSRAVAFVTWLVGRELALECGYFSRQQLQSGVHACVAKKIDSGTITRTKVNRCMQIILNSCFHYIIPRPDGSEENGEAFRYSFAAEAVDDSKELQSLPSPWNDLVVDHEFVLTAASRESSPASSPRLGSQQSKAVDDTQSKRAVLLCFNENVRSFEDVLRCHNEFIRDTANAANLQLSDKEWRTFFGRDTTKTTAWGSSDTSTALVRGEGDMSKLPDVLGRMDTDVLSRFRTTWCAKRYEHDHDLCAFAHLEVNGGWLRRNPLTHRYQPTMCPSVVGVANRAISPFSFMLNQCEKGEECDFAHSNEEISYHPDQYKRKMCSSAANKGGTCPLGDICPFYHTAHNLPRGKRRTSPDRRNYATQRASSYRHSYGHGMHSTDKIGTCVPPEGAPMLYVNPAPVSSFERHLGPPGLQSLFRRHSSVMAGYVRHGERCMCCYSNFGDDWGISGLVPTGHKSTPPRGLPYFLARSS